MSLKKNDRVIIANQTEVLASTIVLSQKSKIWIDFNGVSIPFSRGTETCLRKEEYIFTIVPDEQWKVIDNARTMRIMKETRIQSKVIKDLFRAFEIKKDVSVFNNLPWGN